MNAAMVEIGTMNGVLVYVSRGMEKGDIWKCIPQNNLEGDMRPYVEVSPLIPLSQLDTVTRDVRSKYDQERQHDGLPAFQWEPPGVAPRFGELLDSECPEDKKVEDFVKLFECLPPHVQLNFVDEILLNDPLCETNPEFRRNAEKIRTATEKLVVADTAPELAA
jgi:hypothetical protein